MFEYLGIKIESCVGVYSPGEDTFLIADTIDVRSEETVLDMGTGTGLLGIIAAKTARHVLMVDINGAALRCARENVILNGFENIEIIKSDLFSNILESFDLVIFNPPYLPTDEGEPKDNISIAWDGGRRGRDVIDRFLDGVDGHMKENGRMLMVGSSLSDYRETIQFLENKGFLVSIITTKKLEFEELVIIHANYDF